MLYQLLHSMTEHFSVLNVFRYITTRTFVAFFTSFLVCWVWGPHFIRHLKEMQLGQFIRDDGPQSHKAKQGTPTMGGGLILLSLLIPCLLWVDLLNPLVWGVLFITFGFGGIGYLDDWFKVVRKNHRGLSGRLRLVGEFSISILVITILNYKFGYSQELHFPFFKNWSINLGGLYPFFGALVVVGAANAVNLTDGLDGLAIVPVMVAASTLGLLAYVAGHASIAQYLQIPHVLGSGELTPVAAAVVAAGMGFLWFNSYPAQVFMGDVGSLSLGGFLGAMAVVTRNELIMVLLGGVFVIEALSVISQVISFKLTGKRIFRMAPIHHHFELKGLVENKIIVRFWIVSILLAILSLSTLKLR